MKPGPTIIGLPASRILGSGLPGARTGAVGEGLTALALHEFAEQHPNVIVAHSLSITGSRADIDHIVVIGDQMTVIDSKLWSSNRVWEIVSSAWGKSAIAISALPHDDPETLESNRISTQAHRFHSPRTTNISVAWQAYRMSAVFPECEVTGLICVHGHNGRSPKITNLAHRNSYAPVLAPGDLIKRLDYLCRARGSSGANAGVAARLRSLTAYP